MNEKVISVYGTKVWKLIPKLWRQWWISNISDFEYSYHDITMEYPKYIIVYRSIESNEWDLYMR